jgi:phenylacetate-CoA ligase
MADNAIKRLIEMMPESLIRSISGVPFSLRAGRGYRKTRNLLEKSQWFKRHDLYAYQFKKLKEVLIYSYKKVPYYRDLFDSLSFDPVAFRSFSEFERIPILSKKDVFNNFEKLKSSDFNSLNSYVGHTGGTTGQPLKVLFSIRSHFVEWGFMHAQWQRAGFLPECKRVAFLEIPFRKNKSISWKYNYLHRELQLSPRHMESQNLTEFVKLIKAYRPEFVYGLPSAIMIFAAFLLKKNIKIDGILSVLCGSENITGKQREVIFKAFDAKIYSWYGQTEKVVLGGDCEYSSQYHLFPEYGYTELIDQGENVIKNSDILGEIVGTGFNNLAMPLIRYRTDDFGEYANGNCQCGRNYPRIKNLIGRRDNDYLYDKDGVKILLSSIETQKSVFGNIYQWQFVQKTPGKVRVDIIGNHIISPRDIKEIQKDLNFQGLGKIRFDVAVVSNLIKTELGKTKPLIQYVKEDEPPDL